MNNDIKRICPKCNNDTFHKHYHRTKYKRVKSLYCKRCGCYIRISPLIKKESKRTTCCYCSKKVPLFTTEQLISCQSCIDKFHLHKIAEW